MDRFVQQLCYTTTTVFSVMRALVVCIALVFASQAYSVAIGELISNQAQLQFKLPESNQLYSADSNAVDITKVVKRTPAILEVQAVIPANDANTPAIQAGCNGANGFQEYGDVTHAGLASGGVDINAPLYLEQADIFRVGEPVFVQLTDLDQNLSETIKETVVVTVTSDQNDEEEVVLYESDLDTGVFIGVVPTTRDNTIINNCVLTVDTNESFNITYVDVEDNTDVEASTPLIDPYGIVYDTENGLPVNSATVTIYRVNDDGSTQIATVFADDGVTPWPSSVTTGQLLEAGDFSEQFEPGGFRFPLVAPGNYLIIVDAPNLIDGPSQVAFSEAFEINGNSYLPLENGSYELPFSVPEGPPIRVDIPKDIQAGVSSNFSIIKKASTKYASIGDFVRYTISAVNIHKVLSHNDVAIEDVLPVGMRYVGASTIIDAANVADPVIDSSGRVLSFNVGSLNPLQEVKISYIAQVIASAPQGKITNTAQVKTDSFESELAYADIYITDELMQDTNQLMGRVIKLDCKATDTATTLTNHDLLTLNTNEYSTNVKRAIDDLFSAIISDASEQKNVRLTHYVQEDEVYITHIVDKDYATHNEDALFALTKYLSSNRGFDIKQIEVKYNSKLAKSRQKNLIVIEDQVEEFKYIKTLSYTTLGEEQLRAIENESIRARLSDDIELKNIRVFLEDGRSALTDGKGRYHFDDIDNHAHVVQIDKDSLPENYELVLCEDDTRSANSAFSRFVDVSGGTLWRANFYIKRHVSNVDVTEAIKNEDKEISDKNNAFNQPKELEEGWIDSLNGDFDFVTPLLDYSELPATSVIIKHPNKRGRKIELLINGEPVNAVYRGKMLKNHDGSVAANTWSGVPILEGKNILVANYINSFGVTIDNKKKELFYNKRITQVKLIREKSVLKADGKTMPIIAVQFTDDSGRPAHQNLQGGLDVKAPYQVRSEQQQNQKDLLLRESINNTFVIKEDGIAYIQLEPTQQSGEVNISFPIGERDEVIRAWLEPELRDWILVGIAEGTVGYRTLEDNIQALNAHEKDEGFYKDGRLAFYAKGKVKGEWLLTLAYDTDKENDDKLTRELIDPTLYFTLFADNAKTYQDARSKRKLYLKIERKQFYALFGDYSTGFTETNLANYNRSFNGLKSEYHGDKFTAKAFAAKEETQFVKDEIQGDGTSGAYQLSQRGIIINSESIRIESRDRFDETEVLNVTNLKRFVDYDIDYFEGKLLFKEPIFSRDENLNPVVIVADYETDRLVEGETTFGARASYQVSDKVQIGFTGVREARPNAEADLLGVDVNVEVNQHNNIEIESAQSQSEVRGSAGSNLIRYRYGNDKLAAMVSYKNYDSDFGLGQQTAASQNFEQVAANLVMKLTKRLTLKSQLVDQKNNSTESDSQRISSDLTYQFKNFTGLIGFQHSEDNHALSTQRSDIVNLGAYRSVLNNKLRIGVNADLALSSTLDDKPQRYGLSLDYKILENLSAFYQYEMDRGVNNRDLHLLGLRTQPWTNAELSSYITHEEDNTEAAYRTYSNFGLNQKLPVNKNLTVNFGVDIAEQLDEKHPFESINSSFSAKEDYTALSLGTNYKSEAWSLNNQIEYRDSDNANRWGFRANWYRPIRLGYSYGVRLQYFSNDNQQTNTQSEQGRAEWSMAYRLLDSNWSILERFEYVFDSESNAVLSQETDKLIHHIRANYKKGFDDEWSLGWSIKLNKQQFDNASYSSTSNFLSTEYSHDFKPWLDAGFHASILIADGQAYSFGPNIGVSPYDNVWFTMGYNFSGFTDDDFAAADYTEQGPWLSFRIKFDQETAQKLRQ